MKKQPEIFVEENDQSTSWPAWGVDATQVESDVDTDISRGLSYAQVKNRLTVDGPNQLRHEKRTSHFKRLFNQFKSPVVLILLAAAIISILVGE